MWLGRSFIDAKGIKASSARWADLSFLLPCACFLARPPERSGFSPFAHNANKKAYPMVCLLIWLGRSDSNTRMTESESVALPLGESPMSTCHKRSFIKNFCFLQAFFYPILKVFLFSTKKTHISPFPAPNLFYNMPNHLFRSIICFYLNL